MILKGSVVFTAVTDAPKPLWRRSESQRTQSFFFLSAEQAERKKRQSFGIFLLLFFKDIYTYLL